MLCDGILEVSSSPILNPLTVVHREGKKIRICVDARKVNQFNVPDRERSPPIQEILQRFNGALYLTSLVLSSAYLQIGLHEESRKYTAFLFDSTVYQYTLRRDSSVGIVTGYGLDDQGGGSSSLGRVKNFYFSKLSRPALGSTQPPVKWVPGSLSRG
jgi:hypothetical protein